MKPYIFGNWKMNLSRREAIENAFSVAGVVGKRTEIEVMIAPPFVYLEAVNNILRSSTVSLGAQNCHWEESGPYTGEISCSMLKDCGCKYVIVGHSERRHIFGESEAIIKKKYLAVKKAGLIPILCIGETGDQRKANKTKEIVRNQLLAVLEGGDSPIIAYEPVWAIGTGLTPTQKDIEDIHNEIKNLISDLGYSTDKVPVLYGGSVKPSNIRDIISLPSVDGVLVGGASLKADSFSEIIKISIKEKVR